MEILDKVTIVAVRMSVLSGERRLETDKQSQSRRKTVIQEVIDRKELAEFNQMSSALYRLCRSYGSKIKLLDAWGVENDLAEELLQKIAEFNERFKRKAEVFIEAFPEKNQAWAKKNPDEAEAILNLAYSREELEKGFQFAYAGMQMTREQIRAQEGLEQELEGMAGQALKEFADQIRDRGVKDPSQHVFSAGIANVLREIRRKAASLAFLHPRVQEVADVLDGLLKALPARGKIEDAQSIALRIVIDRLMNPAELSAKGFPKLVIEEEEPAQPAVVQPPEPESSRLGGGESIGLQRDLVDESSNWDEDPDPEPGEDVKTLVVTTDEESRLSSDATAW